MGKHFFFFHLQEGSTVAIIGQLIFWNLLDYIFSEAAKFDFSLEGSTVQQLDDGQDFGIFLIVYFLK